MAGKPDMTNKTKEQARELREAFEEIGQEVTTAMGIGVTAACLFVQAQAKRKVPVDTSLLKNSITMAVTEWGDEVAGYVGTNVEYGPFVEFGTIKMEPKPFLTPALNENLDKVQDIIKKQVAKAVK